MSSSIRFWIAVGLVIGGVWAFEGADGAGITALLALIGLVVGLLLSDRVNLAQLLRDDENA